MACTCRLIGIYALTPAMLLAAGSVWHQLQHAADASSKFPADGPARQALALFQHARRWRPTPIASPAATIAPARPMAGYSSGPSDSWAIGNNCCTSVSTSNTRPDHLGTAINKLVHRIIRCQRRQSIADQQQTRTQQRADHAQPLIRQLHPLNPPVVNVDKSPPHVPQPMTKRSTARNNSRLIIPGRSLSHTPNLNPLSLHGIFTGGSAVAAAAQPWSAQRPGCGDMPLLQVGTLPTTIRASTDQRPFYLKLPPHAGIAASPAIFVRDTGFRVQRLHNPWPMLPQTCAQPANARRAGCAIAQA